MDIFIVCLSGRRQKKEILCVPTSNSVSPLCNQEVRNPIVTTDEIVCLIVEREKYIIECPHQTVFVFFAVKR